MSDVYVRYQPRHVQVARTREVYFAITGDLVFVDVDTAGRIIGVELLNAIDVEIDGQAAYTEGATPE